LYLVASAALTRFCFPEHCLCLITGTPGTGKTTLAMQFLLEGAERGERGLYITLSETKAEIEKSSAAIDGI
jgi:circadian clock protein KaiC